MDRFEDIIGQDEAVRHLQTALKEHRISHSYIIHGDRGSSKKELAMAFAAALLCEQPENGNGIVEPCGKCRSCLQVLAGDHPDIRVFTHRKKTPSQEKDTFRKIGGLERGRGTCSAKRCADQAVQQRL